MTRKTVQIFPLWSVKVNFTIEYEMEAGGRWIAEIVELPGVMSYGTTQDEAVSRAEALAVRVMADRLEAGEQASSPLRITFN